jgi:hypothetical protein
MIGYSTSAEHLRAATIDEREFPELRELLRRYAGLSYQRRLRSISLCRAE